MGLLEGLHTISMSEISNAGSASLRTAFSRWALHAAVPPSRQGCCLVRA